MTPDNTLRDLLADQPNIHKLLLELFSSPEAAIRWLERPKRPFSGKSPIECFESQPEQVEDLLLQIKMGDFS
ncbi:MbcA/ParS/Xre antitoxin family protein [Aliagarivorans marinus]|uniref:MbcA/ParS/Xre antitoxin family protein n=1 Tax=Aliagarivorans marinus TaxID=561965 RepID=UPI00047A6478|nr:MbcA/ParS/Xre antitoxin family protein [Aliagarivorans marinus]